MIYFICYFVIAFICYGFWCADEENTIKNGKTQEYDLIPKLILVWPLVILLMIFHDIGCFFSGRGEYIFKTFTHGFRLTRPWLNRQ